MLHRKQSRKSTDTGQQKQHMPSQAHVEEAPEAPAFFTANPMANILRMQRIAGNAAVMRMLDQGTLLQRTGAGGAADAVETILAPVRLLYQQYEPINKKLRVMNASWLAEERSINSLRWKTVRQRFLSGREELKPHEQQELDALNKEDENNPLEDRIEQQKEKRDKKGMDKYRDENPERVALEHQLTDAIEQARTQIKSLPAALRSRAYLELNRLTPYHFQFDNADILWNGKEIAGGRTCNVTVVTMILQSLGKSSGDYKRHNDARMGAIAKHFGDALQTRGLDPSNLSSLPLADYMQLVAVERLIEGEATEKAIKSARFKASDAILRIDFLTGILKDFGATVNYKEHPLANKLNAIGAKNAAARASKKQLSQDEKDAMFEEVPVDTYKDAFATSLQKQLQAGNQVVVGLHNHFVRLQSIETDGFTVDDPGGYDKESRRVTWEEAILNAYFRLYMVVGEGAVSNDGAETKTVTAGQKPNMPSTSQPSSSTSSTSAPRTNTPTLELTSAQIKNALSYNQDRGFGVFKILWIQSTVGATTNGTMDEETIMAIARWQGKNELTPDGKVAPTTYAKMNASSDAGRNKKEEESNWWSGTDKKKEKKKESNRWEDDDYDGPAWVKEAYERAKAERARQTTAPAENRRTGPSNSTANASVENWLTFLPTMNRKKTQQITVDLQETRTAPKMSNADLGPSSDLTAQQEQIISAIEQNRGTLNIKKLHLGKYGGKYGWSYSGNSKNDATPTALQGSAENDKNKQAEQWIWEELRHEGGTSSINAYDSQMVTWGRGLGAKSGPMLTGVMKNLFKDAEVAAEFVKFGVYYDTQLKVVNTQTGAIEIGQNALALMQADPQLLSVLIAVAENPAFHQDVTDAQWDATKAHGTARVPKYALDWDKECIQVVAHITHWGPAYGWHNTDYKDTNGDMLKILLTFIKKASGGANKNGAYSIFKGHNGKDLTVNLSRWGGGIGLKTLQENFRLIYLSQSDVYENSEYSGKYIVRDGMKNPKDGKWPVYLY